MIKEDVKMKKMKTLLTIILVSTFFLSTCAKKAPETRETEHKTNAHPQWTYEGETGPEHWGELDPSYETCGSGKSQSPIDLTNADAQDLQNIVFHYQPTR
ncbi:MAG: hypothetical protein D6732_12955, partial [Methanobacteriota archaeon]